MSISSQPNLVVFITDQWRGDYLGAAGHPVVQTPNHDRFAREGTLFTQAFTTHPICGPSRCSLCTGWYPHTRGHRTQEFLVGPPEPHLFKCLKNAGYHIAWGGKNDMLTKEAIQETVDTVLPVGGNTWNWGTNPYEKNDPRYYSFYHGCVDRDTEDHRDTRVIRSAQVFLRHPPEEPFCLFLTPGFPHPPYAIEEPYFSMYSPDQMPDAIQVEHSDKPDFMQYLSQYSGLDKTDTKHVRKMQAVYCGMITRMDALLGDLMTTLHETGLEDRTALFSLSDHGNYVGDYGMPEKWHTGFHDAIMKIPLGVRLPDGAGQGLSTALVQHIDVFATLLDLAGAVPEWVHYGRSVLPLLQGRQDEVRDAVFAESGYNHPYEIPYSIARTKMPEMPDTSPYFPFYRLFTEVPHTAGRTLMVRTERYKYVWRQTDCDELYDLHNDPAETVNLASRREPNTARISRDLRDRLLTWSVETGDVMPLPPSGSHP